MPSIDGPNWESEMDIDMQAAIRIAGENAILTVQRDELAAALRLMRDEFAKLPQSLGYEFTHLPSIDAVLAKVKS